MNRKYLLLLICTLSGCIEAESIHSGPTFAPQPVDSCLAIVVDTSKSYSQSLDEKAYDTLMTIVGEFFTQSMGTEARLVISRIDDSDDVVIFDGHPAELMRRFDSAEEFQEFLVGNTPVHQSNVYKAIDTTIEYALEIPGVTDKTRLLAVVLSDLIESESTDELRRRAGNRMLASLKLFQQAGGGIGLYYVDQSEVDRWQKILGLAEFEDGQFVIEHELSGHPTLPSMR